MPRIARGGDRGAATAAHAQDRIQPALVVQPPHHHRQAGGHDRHRLFAQPVAAQVVEVTAAGPGHLLTTHIRGNGRLTQDAEVDDQRRRARAAR